jgi:hypothetical protein
VAPDGLPARADREANFRTNPQLWNSGQLRPNSPRAAVDDVAFTRDLLDLLKEKVPYDEDRVFCGELRTFGNSYHMAPVERPSKKRRKEGSGGETEKRSAVLLRGVSFGGCFSSAGGGCNIKRHQRGSVATFKGAVVKLSVEQFSHDVVACGLLAATDLDCVKASLHRETGSDSTALAKKIGRGQVRFRNLVIHEIDTKAAK